MWRAWRLGRRSTFLSCDAWAPAWPHMPKALCPPQLLSAASLFQLDALQRHCEILCSQTLSVESAVNTYKYAKVRTADSPPLHPGAWAVPGAEGG